MHKKLGVVRKERSALRSGEMVDLTPEGEHEVFAFARVTHDPRDTVIVVVNRSERPQTRKLFAPMCDLPDGLHFKDVLGEEARKVRIRSGSLHLEVAPADAVILVPDDEDETARRFFRGY